MEKLTKSKCQVSLAVKYRINIIRDMVMQLNFTYLPKTGQYSKHMVASQTSWLIFIIRVLNVFDPVCKFFEIYAFSWKFTDISLFVAFLVSATGNQ